MYVYLTLFYFIYIKMRVLLAFIFSVAICGKFNFSASKVPTINDSNFGTLIPNQNCVIIEFFSQQCPHCIGFAPTYEEIYEEITKYRKDILIYKYDGGKSLEKTNLYNIPGYPYMAMFLPGNSTKYHEGFSGARIKANVIDWIYSKCPYVKTKSATEKVIEQNANTTLGNSSIPDITHHLLEFSAAFGEDIMRLNSEYRGIKSDITVIGDKLDKSSSGIRKARISNLTILLFIAIGGVIGYIVGSRRAVNKQNLPL
jgi:hypothetical protein